METHMTRTNKKHFCYDCGTPVTPICKDPKDSYLCFGCSWVRIRNMSTPKPTVKK